MQIIIVTIVKSISTEKKNRNLELIKVVVFQLELCDVVILHQRPFPREVYLGINKRHQFQL